MRPIQILHPLDKSGRKFVEFNIEEGEEISGDRLLENGKIPVDLFFYKKNIDNLGREPGDGARTGRWSSAHEQVDAKILLYGDEQRAEQECLWWIMYFPVTCRAQVMQGISSAALSVIGEHGIPKRCIEVHMTVCEQEVKVEEGSSSGSCCSTCLECLPTGREGNCLRCSVSPTSPLPLHNYRSNK